MANTIVNILFIISSIGFLGTTLHYRNPVYFKVANHIGIDSFFIGLLFAFISLMGFQQNINPVISLPTVLFTLFVAVTVNPLNQN